MEAAIEEWSAHQDSISPEAADFLRKLQKSYVVYGTMVLLPSSAFSSDFEPDCTIAGIYKIPPLKLQRLYATIASHLKATHVATTRPIPPTISSELGEDHSTAENILRSPGNFTPLHGSFGPPTSSNPPTPSDLEAAYWVTAKQNSIFQTWAPRWTMFSRGNVSEKARLLTLPSVLQAVHEGDVGGEGEGCAAVDLYVGIGYFAFSYLKAGVKVVLGWDLNAWSIEGCVRGGKANRWGVQVFDSGDVVDEVVRPDDDTRLMLFNEDNARASDRISALRDSSPPIRHVNCGLLPTSQGSWHTAVVVLDHRYDGWLHIHENFAVAEIESKAEEVRTEIQRLVEESRGACGGGEVVVELVNRLKSYAPRVVHCVVDIRVAKCEPT